MFPVLVRANSGRSLVAKFLPGDSIVGLNATAARTTTATYTASVNDTLLSYVASVGQSPTDKTFTRTTTATYTQDV